MNETWRYFWCDTPSPLHDAAQVAVDALNAAHAKAWELVKESGAKAYAGSPGNIIGLVFAAAPDPTRWKRVNTTNEGDDVYYPKKNTKEGRALQDRIRKINAPNVSETIALASGMDIMRFCGRYMLRTVAWIKDGRLFVEVPASGDGDKFPKVHPSLTECAKWERERWAELGRRGAEADNARMPA